MIGHDNCRQRECAVGTVCIWQRRTNSRAARPRIAHARTCQKTIFLADNIPPLPSLLYATDTAMTG